MTWPAVALLLFLGAVASFGARAESERFVVEDGSWRFDAARQIGPAPRFRVQGAMSPAAAPTSLDARLKLAGALAPQSPLACLAPEDAIFQDSFEEPSP